MLLAEREGFEPSMEVLPPYALSRGAPSTTRPSLLNSVYSAVYSVPLTSIQQAKNTTALIQTG